MTKKCCMNCEYFYQSLYENRSFCTIDNELVKECLEQTKFCRAYKEWFGAVE